MIEIIELPQRTSWWSGGITSAVACFLEKDASPVFIDTGSHHPDIQRFKKDCEKWYGKDIHTVYSPNYKDHFDVIEKTRYVNGPAGARCTTELKKNVRRSLERDRKDLVYVWGFEYGEREQKRAKRIIDSVPNAAHLFPLIDQKITKQDAIRIVADAGIEVPTMYKLGFHNNNCVGCVKGGAAYWNLIRLHFPDCFERMAKLERAIGRSCLKKCFLDDLDPSAGRGKPPLVSECGAVGEGCEVQKSRDYFAME